MDGGGGVSAFLKVPQVVVHNARKRPLLQATLNVWSPKKALDHDVSPSAHHAQGETAAVMRRSSSVANVARPVGGGRSSLFCEDIFA
jgi:hypothetical protein